MFLRSAEKRRGAPAADMYRQITTSRDGLALRSNSLPGEGFQIGDEAWSIALHRRAGDPGRLDRDESGYRLAVARDRHDFPAHGAIDKIGEARVRVFQIDGRHGNAHSIFGNQPRNSRLRISRSRASRPRMAISQ
ncbi:hypothetical protein MSC49_14020 [Methylosinus sp. C49]|nr:hypothetical protein MSC49_14020 [Methylosinus sp. C49]